MLVLVLRKDNNNFHLPVVLNARLFFSMFKIMHEFQENRPL